jgi:hypothetical protein
MSLTKISLAGNNWSLVSDISAGDGKIANIFTVHGGHGVVFALGIGQWTILCCVLSKQYGPIENVTIICLPAVWLEEQG